MAQHLLVAADRYNLERMKLICEHNLSKHIDTDSVVNILVLAEQHSCHMLKEACLKFLRSSRSLKAVMETDGFGHLISSCPGLIKDIMSKLSPFKEINTHQQYITMAPRSICPLLFVSFALPSCAVLLINQPALSASSIVSDKVRAHHHLKIDGYSRIKDDLPNGECVSSCPFAVGGHLWRIDLYPNGKDAGRQIMLSGGDTFIWETNCMSFYLVLVDEHVPKPVKAQFEFSFKKPKPPPTRSLFGKSKPPPLASAVRSFDCHGSCGGKATEVSKLTVERQIRDDSFTIWCDIAVLNEFRAEGATAASSSSVAAAAAAAASPSYVSVPPSDLHRHLGDLLASGDGADVTLEAGGETFKAHRSVLAARSSVLKAELLGPMARSTTAATPTRINDIEAPVFRAMLHFIYTDHLPETARNEEEEEEEEEEAAAAMAQHLLEAADRFNLERLKLVCEDKLCRGIGTATVATTLALAEQHGCHGLKEACVEFLRIPGNLSSAMATDGFEHLTTSCPAILKELMSKLAVVSMVNGCFLFRINDYSRKAGNVVESTLFSAGGYSWRIIYSPSCGGPIFFALVLDLGYGGGCGSPIRARCKLTLLDKAGKPAVPSRTRASPVLDWSVDMEWSCSDLVTPEELLQRRRAELLGDRDRLAVRCDIVFTDVLGGAAAAARPLPPSDLHQHLGKLLSEKVGADVTFQVAGGETFAAHRCVLAARSPVFRAQLFGPMKEGSTDSGVIAIDDMEAEVFSSLLNFIYTESLDDDGDGDDDDGVMAQHQLAPADRYGLDRMKLVCEEKLRRHIDGSSVGSLLVLAERHHCRGLKEACFDFLSSGVKLEDTNNAFHFRMPPAWWPAAAFAGRGDPPRSSTSTIVADAASGSHCLKIDGFSRTKGLPAGERLQSIPFTVGGHRWRLNLQPNGNAAEGHASLYLLLDEDVAKPVTAQFEFSIGAENRPSFFLLHVKRMKLKHAPFTPRVSTCNFASRAAWGFSKFLKWADLENQGYLEYDCFVIKCDVVVINEFRTVGGTTRAAATPAAPSFVSVPPSDLCQQLGVLLDTEKGADVVFMSAARPSRRIGVCSRHGNRSSARSSSVQ
uniref:BTB domain-containing protein n=1 Tax=Oryza glumipatula TaxID=40148 RepID=A0A0E0BAR6_9ORYZ